MPEETFAAADLTAQADSQALLGPALAELRPRDRQLLWLAHAEGYTHREIAQITGLGSASIRLLLFRARRRIAQILAAQACRPERAQPRGEHAQAEPSGNWRSQP
jgi:RNA polymerase sigma-70 factor (ECF subfamily)